MIITNPSISVLRRDVFCASIPQPLSIHTQCRLWSKSPALCLVHFGQVCITPQKWWRRGSTSGACDALITGQKTYMVSSKAACSRQENGPELDARVAMWGAAWPKDQSTSMTTSFAPPGLEVVDRCSFWAEILKPLLVAFSLRPFPASHKPPESELCALCTMVNIERTPEMGMRFIQE